MSPVAPIAERQRLAREAFAAVLIERGCPADAAADVTAHYLRLRVARLDAAIGRIHVTHGGYLDSDVIARAVESVALQRRKRASA